jgi:HNH endonuclease
MSAQLNKRKYKLRAIVPRPIRVDGDVAYIPLTQGYVAVLDADDVPIVSAWNWQVSICGKLRYAVRYTRRDADGKQHIVRLHRHILGVPDGVIVDHIDHDGLNNRKANLRPATHQQNAQNTRKVGAKTLPKGVYQRGHRFRARVWINGRNVHLGMYDTADDAHRAFCDAVDKLHGEFACHN